jgi:hypothetical protein
VLAANLRWLSDYKHPRTLNPGHARALETAFAVPAPLLEGTESAGDPIAVLPSVFHMLWSGGLRADLVCGPLGGSTLVNAASPGAAGVRSRLRPGNLRSRRPHPPPLTHEFDTTSKLRRNIVLMRKLVVSIRYKMFRISPNFRAPTPSGRTRVRTRITGPGRTGAVAGQEPCHPVSHGPAPNDSYAPPGRALTPGQPEDPAGPPRGGRPDGAGCRATG